MPIHYSTRDLRFRLECRGAYSGQKDLSLFLYEKDVHVGYIDYSESNGVPALQFVGVQAAHVRRGFATVLIKRLQQMYSNREIQWGLLTDDGIAFYDSLVKTVRPVHSVIARKRYLSALIQNRDRITAACDTCAIQAKPTNLQLQAHLAEVDSLNGLHDQIYDLESALEGKKSSVTLIDTTGAVELDRAVMAD